MNIRPGESRQLNETVPSARLSHMYRRTKVWCEKCGEVFPAGINKCPKDGVILSVGFRRSWLTWIVVLSVLLVVIMAILSLALPKGSFFIDWSDYDASFSGSGSIYGNFAIVILFSMFIIGLRYDREQRWKAYLIPVLFIVLGSIGPIFSVIWAIRNSPVQSIENLSYASYVGSGIIDHFFLHGF